MIKQLKLTDKLIINRDIVVNEDFDDCTILFHPILNDAIGVSPVGITIWKVLEGQLSLAEVVETIKTQFEDTPETVMEDTMVFSQNLYNRQFVWLAQEGEKK